MYNYAITVDWLQVYTLLPRQGVIGWTLPSGCDDLNLTRIVEPQGTAIFNHMITVKSKQLPVASVLWGVRTSNLEPRMCLIKLENRTLYSQGYIRLLYIIIKALGVEYKGITRIDLAYDCNLYAGGRKPGKFINEYISKSEDELGGVARKGSSEFTCHGSKQRGESGKINYLSFGAPTARVRAYIYNKTKELKEVKDKYHIRKMWEINGLVNTEECPVWRSEISIKAEGQDLLNMATGELFKLSVEHLEHQEAIERLFRIYAERYFYFTVNKGQKRRKDRPRLVLFENSGKVTTKPVFMSRFADTGRMEMIVAKKIDEYAAKYTNLSGSLSEGLMNASMFFKSLSGVKSSAAVVERNARALSRFGGKITIDHEFKRQILRAQEQREEYLKIRDKLTQLHHEQYLNDTCQSSYELPLEEVSS